MKQIIYIIIAAIIVVWFVFQKFKEHQLKESRLSVIEFKKALRQDKIQIVDVRTVKEFNTGHIKNAININVLSQNKFKEQIETLDKNKPTYIYCRSGKRSLKALDQMLNSGFVNIYDLKGGYIEWLK
ncbi:rhodanese-related sulfurtransferase [Wenyingzhuangia heitensis]|uniref:Rhodanese-related sulfurtransferase n=1 Tax=Wenyingzhuangia heitensis TaxID=1487859 RepID=A0ABX0UBT9_9FLAO|nr:rhodanese-like domain-containing protein [Wenyingzhuangia heitensis]NIJ44626.1 rhodanese-related sulfurtransferase [Wenyingzhuangia heitensis]